MPSGLNATLGYPLGVSVEGEGPLVSDRLIPQPNLMGRRFPEATVVPVGLRAIQVSSALCSAVVSLPGKSFPQTVPPGLIAVSSPPGAGFCPGERAEGSLRVVPGQGLGGEFEVGVGEQPPRLAILVPHHLLSLAEVRRGPVLKCLLGKGVLLAFLCLPAAVLRRPGSCGSHLTLLVGLLRQLVR